MSSETLFVFYPRRVPFVRRESPCRSRNRVDIAGDSGEEVVGASAVGVELVVGYDVDLCVGFAAGESDVDAFAC